MSETQAPVTKEALDLSSGFSKMLRGLRRTWKLYRASKMGLIGLGIVIGFVVMAVFAPIISPYSPSFRAPSSDIFIADYANLGLPIQGNWSAPMGIPTVQLGNALKRILVYSSEGDAYIYPVSSGRSEITGGSGILVGDPTHLMIPSNISYISYVRFPTPFPLPGNVDISGSFFFILEGTVLHQYASNLVASDYFWNLPFVPTYHSNLWNGYVPQTSEGRLALAFANETSVWLISMRAGVTADPFVRSYTSNITIPGVKIISSPIVMDTLRPNGSVLAVPTDKGIYTYALNITTTGTLLKYVTDVRIGDLLWTDTYEIAPGDIVQPIESDALITFPNPMDATTLFGKTEIAMATADGRVVAFDTFNGSVKWANRIIMGAIPTYKLTGLYPASSGITVVGEAGATRGFIASLEPDAGFVISNNTAYSQTEGLINAPPQFVASLRNYVYTTDRGIIYLADELTHVYATFTVPSGGVLTPVSYLGNIYIADSETGNYFGTVTKENTLYVETLSGVNVAPLPPGTYPSGNRYILGTDYEGHDILSWLVYGTRSELLVGVTAAVFAVVIGTVVGLVAGFYSGLVDDLLMRATDVVLSLPFIVIALLFASVFGPLLVNIIIIIAVLSWAGIARVIRSVTLSLKERAFVDAAIIAGASESRLIFRHIAPNVLPYTFLYMTFTVSGAIITEAILAFLGFGDPSNVTWGMMLQFLQISGHSLDAPWWLLPPGIAITLLSLSFYLIGRAFDEVVNPRLRRR